MVFQSFFRFRGYFCNFYVSEVFQSFFRFMGYFGNFKVLGRIYVVFRFRMYFGGFMGTLVFLVVLGCFRVG